MESPIIIRSAPGIKRDGTQFDGSNYVDGQWCRFQRGLPRKIAGYQAVTESLIEKVYGMDSFSQNSLQYVHMGTAGILYQALINNSGSLSTLNNRTPALFANDPNNLWQFAVLNDGTSATSTQIVAHATPSLAAIDSNVATPIYYDSVTGVGPLANQSSDTISGGIVAVNPFLLAYGSGGRVDIYDPGVLTAPSQTAFVTSQKIVKGLRTRGTTNGPSGLLWALDDLIRFDFTSVLSGTFGFNSLGEISVMSSQGIIEYDNIYYWPGVDRWMMYNGVLREIPNNLNTNFFFDNVNMTWRQKVFAFKVPRFGEIWWCFPRGEATECTHAVIYNVRENYWYDTALPGLGRTSGIFAKVYNKPFMTDLEGTPTGFTLWQHETGTDEARVTATEPILSYFETGDISPLTNPTKPELASLRVERVEPDFVQSGEMTLQVKGRSNARAPEIVSDPVPFPESASNSNEQTVTFREVRRLMRFKFQSNTLAGNYEMGQVIGHVDLADKRTLT